MKIALITDQHFGARNDSISFLDFYEKFYNNIFFPELINNKINTLLILGDTFDRRKFLNYNTLKRTREMFFDRLSELNINVHVLVGNHDTTYKNTNEVNSVDLVLKDYNNIDIISNPKSITLDDTEFLMIPWICQDNYDESVKLIEESKAKICCGHFEIEGFAMYRGMTSHEGMSRTMFRKFEYTFSGNYHHRSSEGDIYYLGNPYELTWQDYNDPRGFHILDITTRDIQFIKNPYSMFHKLIYDDKEESITEINNKDLSQYQNTYVRVVVVNKTNPYLFDKFISNLYEVNPADITIAEDMTDINEGIDDDMINEAEDTITILNKYVDSIQQEDIDSNKLKNVLRELYVEALSIE